MSWFPLVILAMMAGAFISFGAMYYTVVMTDPTGGYGVAKLLGGLSFSLGFILVVIAGAELFTGNTLVVMAFADRDITLMQLLRNWSIVYVANAVGALVMVYLVYLSGYLHHADYAVGATALKTGIAKVSHTPVEAFVNGLFCNVLVCLASWMVYAARSVLDKIAVVLFPISAFVAMGFEHCIANMYMIPIAILASLDPAIVEASHLATDVVAKLNVGSMMGNIIPVTIGNIVGGVGFVGMTYYLVFRNANKQDS
jgi:formate/nitrite transporter